MNNAQTPGEARRLVERAMAAQRTQVAHAIDSSDDAMAKRLAAENERSATIAAADAHDARYAALVQAAEAVLEWTRTPYGARLSVFAELRAALMAAKGE